MTDIDAQTHHSATGLRYARWAGLGLGCVLIAMALVALTGSRVPQTFDWIKNIYFIVYGVVLILPYARLGEKVWKPAFIALTLLSALFVFVMVAHVMFAYMAAAEIGEKLGVPGFEGTLIFLALMQVPVVLFQKKPDLLD